MKKFYIALLIVLSFWTGRAQIVNIPDVNFKNALLSYSPVIDINTDGQIDVNEAIGVLELYLPDLNITDLTGIEAFTNLTYLWVENNHLTDLPVSSLTNLQALNCNENNLSSLNLSNLSGLEFLECYYNSIAFLDTASLPNLYWIDCSYNQLTDLNLSNATKLFFVEADNNLFTSLDFSHFIPNEQNPATLYHLRNNPNLVSLNIKNGAPLITQQPGALVYPFAVSGCSNLTYVCADDFNLERIAEYTAGNPNVQLSSSCSLKEVAFEDKTVSAYPNPVVNQIHIQSDENIISVQVYDIQGRLVEERVVAGKDLMIDLAKSETGIYFVRISTDSGMKVEKVIKE